MSCWQIYIHFYNSLINEAAEILARLNKFPRIGTFLLEFISTGQDIYPSDIYPELYPTAGYPFSEMDRDIWILHLCTT